MNIGTARAIFDNIENSTESIGTKALAIRMVLDMKTHNSVTKASMLKVINWFWDQCFEMEQEDEE